MAKAIDTQSRKLAVPWWLYLILALLLVVAYFWNLGLMPLWNDEPIRALVSLEMLLTGEWIVPHMGGEIYYRKPPLYNWLLTALFATTDNYSEFMIRIPAIAGFFGMALAIYFFGRKEVGKTQAALVAFAYLTGVRIIGYDSMSGHIDPIYSWVTFAAFLAVYKYRNQNQWLKLFCISWGLTAIGYMLKAMPSLLFQTFTLAVILYDRKHFRWLYRHVVVRRSFNLKRTLPVAWGGLHRLWVREHLIGFMFFLVPVCAYFLLYHQHNPIQNYLAILWDQSSQRTVTQNSLLDTFIHLFTFPFELLGEIAPLSLLVLFALSRKAWDFIKKDSFLWFGFLVVAINIPVYWLSPGTFARYHFMMYPLILFILLAVGDRFQSDHKKLSGYLDAFLMFAVGLLSMVSWFPAIVGSFRFEGWIIMSALYSIMMLIWLFMYIRIAPRHIYLYRWFVVIGVMLTLRLLFNFYAIPDRVVNSPEGEERKIGLEIARITDSQPLIVYSNAVAKESIYFYITRARKQVIPQDTVFLDTDWVLVDEARLYKVQRKATHLFVYEQGKPPLCLCPPVSSADSAQQ